MVDEMIVNIYPIEGYFPALRVKLPATNTGFITDCCHEYHKLGVYLDGAWKLEMDRGELHWGDGEISSASCRFATNAGTR